MSTLDTSIKLNTNAKLIPKPLIIRFDLFIFIITFSLRTGNGNQRATQQIQCAISLILLIDVLINLKRYENNPFK